MVRSFETEAFTSEDGRSDFECGSEALDRFFRSYAGQDQKRGVSRTWVLRRQPQEPELPRVLGFYTLALGILEKNLLPEDLSKGLPHYPLPVVIIGRLARHVRVRGQGCGERLLLDAHERVLAINEHVGCFAIIVDAKDPAASEFYQDFGYAPLPSSPGEPMLWPQRMLQPLKRIRDA